MKKKLEEQLQELEVIITELESGDLDLDSAINKYTEAMKIAKEANLKLSDAEGQINKILAENNELKDFNIEEKASN
jgi:exodeoxyribonuclease VII small subunit